MLLSGYLGQGFKVAVPIAVLLAVPLAMAIDVCMLKAMHMDAPIGCACYMVLNLSDL